MTNDRTSKIKTFCNIRYVLQCFLNTFFLRNKTTSKQGREIVVEFIFHDKVSDTIDFAFKFSRKIKLCKQHLIVTLSRVEKN